MLYLGGIIIAFFLFLILITKKGKSIADTVLAFWLGITGIHLFLFYLYISNTFLQFPYFLGAEIPMPLLYGPLLYLYTRSLTKPEIISTKVLLHFVPFVLGIIALFPFWMLSFKQRIEVYQNEGQSFKVLLWLFLISFLVSGITYSVLSVKAIAAHKKNIEANFSDIEKINLKWLQYLVAGLSAIWIIVIFGTDQQIFIAVVLFIIFKGYFGIKQVGIFTNIPIVPADAADEIEFNETDDAITITPKVKYDKSELSQEQLTSIHKDLVALMNTRKLFLIPEVTLADVAKELEVHPNILSQVVNRMEQKNFFDYINSKRVVAFKNKIADNKNKDFTLLALAYECGFNSKTSFNRNFKKITGISPTEFVKQQE